MFGRSSLWQRLGISASGSAPSDTKIAEEERRVWVRYPANLETTYQAPGQAEASRSSALVRDISCGGANLLVQQPFQPGDMLSVELPTADAESANSVLACVVRISPEGDGFALGCIFSRELSAEDLEAFGAKRQKHSPADQRTWMRFPCQVKATYQVVGYEETPILPGEVLNISASGISLLVNRPIEMGSLLNLELQHANGDSVRTMLGCVVRSNQDGPRWALGCNFIRELSEEDLQALVSV